MPKFKGLNTFEKVLLEKEKKTGCTVHFVNEKLDAGKIILKKFFYVDKKIMPIPLKKDSKFRVYCVF